MVVLEAMACGCPILIANSEHSAAKFFVQENGYVFDPKDPKDLADKLMKLINNPQLLSVMREKSLQESTQFTFAQSIQKLEEFFLSFCSSK
jgi:glycosyltransferase involved in cell wall biosynthesis